MIANYHTHTWRCNHASGTEEEYIQLAIERGVRVLGFADHAPMPFCDGHYSGFRMTLEQFPDYMETLLALREKYRSQIELLIGLEVEYYPAVFADLLAFVRPYPVDYLILGQHFIGNEGQGDPYSGAATEDAGVLKRYVDQVITAIETDLISYIAHPDLIHYVGDDAIYRREMTRLCQAAKRLNVPLEINLLGLSEGRHYPVDKFWQIAAERGNVAILGCDAHQVHRMAAPAEIEQGRAYAKKFGITLLQECSLRKPY
ncbi:MAG: histidinol-phosphatase [Clostridia bacterium]|nr:histidinol-phosphatase [Clostridia bacterium]